MLIPLLCVVYLMFVHQCDALLRASRGFAPLRLLSTLLSGCICILLYWDEERKNLIRNLRQFNIPTLVLVITEQEESIYDFDLGKIHSLSLGKIQEGLLEVRSNN